ncbi:zinc-ribbon domain-containing protein [Kribbella sp. NPDC002412]
MWGELVPKRSGAQGRPRRLGWLSGHPLAAEFDSAVNHPLTPQQVAQQSNTKVHWVCEFGHRWRASPNNRVGKGSGCPDCGGYRVNDGNRLSLQCPDKTLLEQWDYERNDLTPDDFSVGSHKRVWWTCPAAEDHRWSASIDKRVNGRNCPFCSGKRVSSTNRLSVHRPDIAAQLDTTRSGFTAEEVSVASVRVGVWNCGINENHPPWPAPVSRRTGGWVRKGAGCPSCRLAQVSVQELRLKAELATVLPIDETRRSVKDAAGRVVKVDMVAEDDRRGLRLILEFDGVWWHSKPRSAARDADKADRLRRAGWTVVRVREAELERLDPEFDLVVDPQMAPEEAAVQVLQHLVALRIVEPAEADAYTNDDLPRATATADVWIRRELGESALPDERRSQEAAWIRILESLTVFEAEHGHCCVPAGGVRVDGVDLARWITKQRGRHRRGQLPPDRQELLRSIPTWTFAPTEENFNQQRDRYVKHYLSAAGLDELDRTWANNMRTRRRMLQAGGRDFSQDRLEDMAVIPGWDWDPRAAGIDHKVEVLESYIRETGIGAGQIKQRDIWRGEPIGSWINTWRTNPDRLSLEQRSALEGLRGWTWKPRNDIWESRLIQLQQFGIAHGHLRPSLDADDEDEQALARWKRNNKNRLRGRQDARARQLRELLAQYGEIMD